MREALARSNVIQFVKHEPVAEEKPEKTDELRYVYLVYSVDRIKKKKEVVYVCSRYDFATSFMDEREGTEYGITYEGEGWPLDWYDTTN